MKRMFIVKGYVKTDRDNQYIMGVFDTEEKAYDYMNEPDEVMDRYCLVEMNLNQGLKIKPQ